MSAGRAKKATHAAALVLIEDGVDDYVARRRAVALVQALERLPSQLGRWRLVQAELSLTPPQATRWLEHVGYLPDRGARTNGVTTNTRSGALH